MTDETIRSQENRKASSVEFHDVSKVYGTDVTAVNRVSLRVEAGELVTLLGPSGCGKTTTLRMIAGLEFASSGSIVIGNTDVTHVSATDRDVAMVFQSYALFPHMSVFENVAYGLRMSKIKNKEIQERVHYGLNLVGLEDYGDRYPSELSGGQQQRVAVARALVLEPQVLLFDEPLSNLDAKLRRQVREDIRDIQTNLGLTVIYVTHDQEEALAVSDRIIVMNNAAIAQVGTPRELYDTPANEFIADFIGEANLFDVNISSINDDIATIEVGSAVVKVSARGRGMGNARLAVRPTRLMLTRVDTKNTLKGQVEKVTYAGSHMEYQVATSAGDIFIVTDVDTEYEKNDEVGVAFMERGPVLLTSSA